MKLNLKKETLLFILLFVGAFCCSCGDSNLKLKPGEKLSDILEDHDKEVEAEKRSEELSNTIEQCGLGAIPSEEQLQALAPQMNFDISTEQIEKMGAKLTAVSIRSSVFRLDHFSKVVGSKNKILAKTSEKDSHLALLPSIGNAEDRSPIVIRSNCFFLKSGERIDTKGRDLYIVTDRAIIDGTISTTPEKIENQPGLPAGDILIYAIDASFGPSSKLIANGGDGGDLTKEPTIDLDKNPDYKNQLLADVKNRYVTEIKYPLYSAEDRLKNPMIDIPDENDVPALIAAYESIRPKLAMVEPMEIDRVLIDQYQSEDRSFQIWRDSLISAASGQNRAQWIILNDYWVEAWKFSLAQATQLFHFEINVLNSENIPEFWIVDRRLSVRKQVHISQEIVRPNVQKLKIYRPWLVYQNSGGGSSGSVQVVSASGMGRPDFHGVSGIPGKPLSKNGWPAWKISKEEDLKINLQKKKELSFLFLFRKETGDKDSVFYETPSVLPMAFQESFQTPVLVEDIKDPVNMISNNQLSSNIPKEGRFTFERNLVLVTEFFEVSGLEAPMPSYFKFRDGQKK